VSIPSLDDDEVNIEVDAAVEESPSNDLANSSMAFDAPSNILQLYLANSFSISPYTRTLVPGKASRRNKALPPKIRQESSSRYTPISVSSWESTHSGIQKTDRKRM